MIRNVFLFLLISCRLFAQTGIGTTTPHASAKLDVSATNKGFLPPRVTLTSATDVSTIASPAEGLLVYNLGSVGLQAGYYYWNGANWATIATATLAGNAVVASDLVKLYNESYSTASGKIAHANGYGFTVPVSGRYLFDFSSSGYLNQAVMSITFKVRQGATDLGTDIFSNANNNVHVVFTGMIEVNLQAGITYNVFVSSSGSRDAGDYDRVFYKMVAGNLPINQFNLGDIKTGIQSGDHNGWVKLDGRLKSTLTASQQLQATALGIGNNLPDATDAVLVQSSGSLGSVTGSMSRTIAQNQLPNITFTGSINGIAHGASVQASASGVFTRVSAGSTGNATGGGVTNTFNLSIPLNGGVTQQSIDITPRKLVVNTFIYLGN
jgi:hypothetical protein